MKTSKTSLPTIINENLGTPNFTSHECQSLTHSEATPQKFDSSSVVGRLQF
jgi:hypothetical protein